MSINKQKATLYGLDKLRVDLQRFDATLDLNKMVDVTNRFGLGPVGLKAVGDCVDGKHSFTKGGFAFPQSFVGREKFSRGRRIQP